VHIRNEKGKIERVKLVSEMEKSCSKCNGNTKKEELVLQGKGGVLLSKGWKFNAYICQKCGFTEFYFEKTAAWL